MIYRKAFCTGIKSFILLVVGSISLFFANVYYQYHSKVIIHDNIHYHLPRGASLNTLIQDLQRLSPLPHVFWVKLLLTLNGHARQLQAGEYRFRPGASLRDVILQVQIGNVIQHQFTIIEGWTVQDLLAALKLEPSLDKHKPALNRNNLQALLSLSRQNAEGLFFADTYHYTKNMSDLEVLQRSKNTLDKQLKTLWETRDRALPYKSAYDALIAASLIEKETASATERYLVSSVIINRLQKKMPLQIDPAVSYGLYQSYDHTLTSHDLRLETRYNTYLNKGLPPSPICMPGYAALFAALHPAKTDYYYFVVTEAGRHRFSKTYKEHQRAVKDYRLERRVQALKRLIGIDNESASEICHL